MGPVNAKRDLRAAMRVVRAAIAADPTERTRRSLLICQRVIDTLSATGQSAGGTGVRSVQRLLVYEALPGEPDLSALTRWAADRQLEVHVPHVDGRDLLVMPGDIDPSVLDAVVVPGLAFTRDGHRLGQGGGHFDRFLPRLSTACWRIGVGFREQLVDDLPVEPHDVTLDVVVTDE